MGRFAESTAVRIALFALIAMALVWTMLPNGGWLNEFRDAQVLTLHERAAVDSVRRFGELPLWDPWYCGGLYGLGAPQSRFASPPFLLSLLFGVERAEPLVIFLFAVLGMEGTYRWVRLRVVDATAALRIAPLFALSGHFAVAHFRGWTNFFGFELVPFVLLGITMAARGRTWGIAVSSIAFAVMLGFGGTFAAPIVAVAAIFEALRAISEAPPSRRGRAIWMLLAVASFMVTVAAVRLLPIAETLLASPRIMAGTPGHSPKALLDFLVKSLEVKNGDVLESGAFFVGAAFLALVALGGSERKSVMPLVIVVLCLWLAAGYARKPPLFALLRQLPVFSALRYPERFLWIGILYACEPAAHALAKLPRLGEGRRWRVGANLVLTIAVIGTIGTQVFSFAEVGKARELGVVAVDRMEEFRQSRGNRWLAAHYQGIGAGSLSCWETHPVIMSPKLRGDLANEEYFEDPSLAAAKRVSWSPNRIVVHVDVKPGKETARLLVNQNWHPGWRSSIGSVVSDDGLLAVDLPEGANDVTLEFRPRSALAGGVVTLVALVSILLLGAGARGGRIPFRRSSWPRTAGLVLLPWALAAAFFVTWSEPRYPPAPQRNANGTPAFADEPGRGSVPIHAQFELPIVLDAVRFGEPNNLKNLAIDLYFRRTGAVPRTTGMFVHVIRREGQAPVVEPAEKGKEKPREFFNADHQVVGGSFYLSDAPEGKLVHDAFGIQVGKAAPGDWDVWLGFGHVSGRRGRAKVVDPGTSTVNEDRVRIGTFTVPAP
jgi:hypothetical protein